jgi:hypothetical protein
MELHRAVSTGMQALSQHHSLLVGAVLGCDAATQQSMLEEHRMRVAAALEALARLANFIDQCRIGPAAEAANSGRDGVMG